MSSIRLTKKQIINRVADEAGLPRTEVSAVIDGFLHVVGQALKAEERVSLRRFGTFQVRHRAERAARNPATGKPITVPAQKAPVFVASRDLKSLVNEG